MSMDARGRCWDNIFIERLWRSLKYEDIYLKGYETVAEIRHGVDRYFDFYNQDRFHQALVKITISNDGAGWTLKAIGPSGIDSDRGDVFCPLP